jgi:hypothetical protein
MATAGSLLAMGCFKKTANESSNRLLATVYSKSLYLNELEGIFPEEATSADSAQVVGVFVNNWIRDQLLVAEAERNIPQDLNLDELLSKYRSSLVLNAYEENLSKNGLDTTIGDTELQAFYEQNKAQYELATPIFRCYFLKVPKPVTQSDSLSKWWNSPKSGDNLAKMQAYAAKYAKTYSLLDSVWHRADDIIGLLPKGTLSADNISSGDELTLNDDNFQYYFRALRTMSKKEIAPLSFIRNQASKVILHARKIQLLEKKKSEMYEQETRKNNIKIY